MKPATLRALKGLIDRADADGFGDLAEIAELRRAYDAEMRGPVGKPAETAMILTRRVRRQPASLGGHHYHLAAGSIVWLVSEQENTIAVSSVRHEGDRIPEDVFHLMRSEAVPVSSLAGLIAALSEAVPVLWEAGDETALDRALAALADATGEPGIITGEDDDDDQPEPPAPVDPRPIVPPVQYFPADRRSLSWRFGRCYPVQRGGNAQ
jgi:hypothetical protein